MFEISLKLFTILSNVLLLITLFWMLRSCSKLVAACNEHIEAINLRIRVLEKQAIELSLAVEASKRQNRRVEAQLYQLEKRANRR